MCVENVKLRFTLKYFNSVMFFYKVGVISNYLYKNIALKHIRQKLDIIEKLNDKYKLEKFRNQRYAFLRRVSNNLKEKYVKELKEKYSANFVFTSKYIENCDIFMEMDENNFDDFVLNTKNRRK